MLLRREKMESTLSALIDTFIMAKKVEGLSQKTLDWYAWLLGKFAAFLENPKLSEVSLEDSRRFVAALQERHTRYDHHPRASQKAGGLSTQTIAAYVRAMKVFSAWLYEENLTKTNLFAKLKRPKVDDTLVEILTDEEIARLVKAVNPNCYLGARLYAIFLLLLDTGIRASELCTLTLEHTNLEGATIRVMGKGRKERVVPFGNSTKRALMRYVGTFRPTTDCPYLFVNEEGQSLTYNALRLILLRLGQKTEITRLHPHLLRHTFAVNYLIAGGDLMTLRLLLGHTDITTTQMYLKLSDSHIKAQYNRFSPVDRLVASPSRRGQKAPKGARAN